MSERAHLSIPVGPEDHARGPADAKLTVVEYGDYQCPYCGQAYPIVEKLVETFADSMRLVFRNFAARPTCTRTPKPRPRCAEASGLQGQFWPMHDALYENQRDLSDGALRATPRRRASTSNG